MMDCKQVLSELWDWLADEEAHPETHALNEHLEVCPACRAEASALRRLKGALREQRPLPEDGFDERLRRRLAEAGAPVVAKETDSPMGKVVRASFWRRPLALVATGAAAVLVLGLAAGRLGDGSGPLGPTAGGLAAPGAATAAADPVGVVAERAWGAEDSLRAGGVEPGTAEPLVPVSTQQGR